MYLVEPDERMLNSYVRYFRFSILVKSEEVQLQ